MPTRRQSRTRVPRTGRRRSLAFDARDRRSELHGVTPVIDRSSGSASSPLTAAQAAMRTTPFGEPDCYVSAATMVGQNRVKPLSSSGWGPETDSTEPEMNTSSSVFVGVPL
jgi:hypothetical protein